MNQVITDKESGIVLPQMVRQPTKEAVLLLIHGLCGQSNRWEVFS